MMEGGRKILDAREYRILKMVKAGRKDEREEGGGRKKGKKREMEKRRFFSGDKER